jgi:hypothetical protein
MIEMQKLAQPLSFGQNFHIFTHSLPQAVIMPGLPVANGTQMYDQDRKLVYINHISQTLLH